MKSIKPSVILAIFSWLYVFGISALMFFRKFPAEAVDLILFFVFTVIALFASAVSAGKRKISTNDIRVSINGHVFTRDALHVVEMKDGGTFVLVDMTQVGDNEKLSKEFWTGRASKAHVVTEPRPTHPSDSMRDKKK